MPRKPTPPKTDTPADAGGLRGGKASGKEKFIPKKTVKQFSDQAIIDALYDCNGLVLRAARRLECTPKTIYDRVNSVPAVATALAAARERAIDFAEDALHSRVDAGDTTAIIFMLKTLGKSRGYVERTETTGANGEPIQTKTVVEVHYVDPDRQD